MITVGILTLNRYDLLPRAINSILNGNLKPDKILVVDNGGTLPPMGDNVEIYHPGYNLGVAGGWNYIIKHSTGYRIILNDDIQLYPNSLEKMVAKLDEGFAWTCICRPYGIINGFSCFGIQDSCIEKVGYFDETISPNYAYFEDNDYAYRMGLVGVIGVDSEAEALHDTSSTLKAFTPEQMSEHHRRFALAQANYIRKWGGLPQQEKYKAPYNA